jgi:hypothetical protein
VRPRKKSKAQSWQVGEASQFLKCGKAHERATNAIGVAAEWPCSSRQPWRHMLTGQLRFTQTFCSR